MTVNPVDPLPRPNVDNLRGALYMMLSTMGFVANDTLMKTLAERMSLPQALLIRGGFASGLLLVLVALQGVLSYRPDAVTTRLVGLRVLCEIAATFAFLSALFHMPIANATAVAMVTPLAVTLGAALFLGEPVGWKRYMAVGVGFAGVLLIVRPGGSGFTAYALLALAAVGFTSTRDLITRRFQAAVPSSVVALATAFAVTVTGGALTPVAGWRPLDLAAVLILAAAAVGLVVGYVFIVMTMRIGDVSFVSPFRYSVLLWALILGALVFDEFPDTLTLLGSLVVVAAGVYTLHTGRVVRRRMV